MNAETSLSNDYVCGKKAKGHLSPATEFLMSLPLTFEITPKSVHFLTQTFNYDHRTWFKFITIHDTITPMHCSTPNTKSNDHYYRMFVCNGSVITRHSVIYIDAIARILTDIENDPDCTLDAKYYPYLNAYRELVACKESKRPGIICKDRLRQLKYSLNSEINKHFECMKVISAGSGTVFTHKSLKHGEKYSVCLNTKSGHYKPSLKDIELAKQILLDIISKIKCSKTRDQFKVIAQYKPNKKTLKKLFGENIAKTKPGLCLPKRKKTRSRRRQTVKNKKIKIK